MTNTNTLSVRDHAKSLYRQMLAQLKRYNEAEAEMEAIYAAELKKALFATDAMMRADEVAIHSGLLSKRNNSRDAVQMLSVAYLVTVDYGDRFESTRGQ